LPTAISVSQKGDFFEAANQCLEIILVRSRYSKIYVFKGADVTRGRTKYINDFKIIPPPQCD